MTEPGGQRTEHRREKPPIPSFGMKINVQRVVDYNCERGRSAKSVLSVDFTRLFKVIVAAPEKGFDG